MYKIGSQKKKKIQKNPHHKTNKKKPQNKKKHAMEILAGDKKANKCVLRYHVLRYSKTLTIVCLKHCNCNSHSFMLKRFYSSIVLTLRLKIILFADNIHEFMKSTIKRHICRQQTSAMLQYSI